MLRRRRNDSLDHRLSAQEFSRALALVVDEAELHQIVAARLRETFSLAHITIFLSGGQGLPLRAVATRGLSEELLATVTFPVTGRLARWLKVNETPLVVAEQPGIASFLSPPELESLQRLGVAGCFPLMAMNRLTGFLAVGPVSRTDGLGLASEQRNFLVSLAGQAALAFENAALARDRNSRIQRMHHTERLATAGEIAAGAAHEIRNPLTSLRLVLQALGEGHIDEGDRSELIGEVLGEVDRIDKIVDGLLSFARPGEAAIGSLDLSELIRQSVSLIGVKAAQHRVDIEVDAREPVLVRADPNHLKQILVNLFLNAFQAMPDGGAVRVGVHADEFGSELRVSDTGQGIPPEHVARIFDPFFTTRSDGTGLGLAISHGLLQAQGGEITVESELGVGTTFTIRLPDGS